MKQIENTEIRTRLDWRSMREVMNKQGLNRTPGNKSSLMTAHGEFYKILEKLSANVWQYYHPEEDKDLPENKKLIKSIARADYFSELIESLLEEIDIGKENNKK